MTNITQFQRCSKCENMGRIQICRRCYDKSEFTPRKAIKKLKVRR